MRRMITEMIAVAVILSALTIGGCQEQNLSGQDKEIKILKNEKLMLQKQITALSKQVEEQKNLLLQCRHESEKQIKNKDDAMADLVMIVAESDAQFRALKQENEELKAKLNR